MTRGPSRRMLLRPGGAGFVAAIMPRLVRAQVDNPPRAVMHTPLHVIDPANNAWSARSHGLNIQLRSPPCPTAPMTFAPI